VPHAHARAGANFAKLEPDQVELIDHVVRSDRRAVSSALLQIAGIAADETSRHAVPDGTAAGPLRCWGI
jgi:hypothetical protein